MLELRNVHSHFGLAEVLDGVSISVKDEAMVGIIGSNGAGKSTTILSICGLQQVTAGEILLNGEEITNLVPQQIKKLGISTVPEGRRLFVKMTVFENLLIGAHLCNDRLRIDTNLSKVFTLFPGLKERKKQLAGSLSGGEQQMLAIARAIMGDPMIILADEISLGLAPIVIKDVYRTLESVNKIGVSVLFVEQQATIAFKYSSYIYVMEQGKVVIEGSPGDLIAREEVIKAYLGD
jgi:branched-chain amino acid transport system ATP-binding protein